MIFLYKIWIGIKQDRGLIFHCQEPYTYKKNYIWQTKSLYKVVPAISRIATFLFFSSECVFCEKSFPHCLHWYGFFPVCPHVAHRITITRNTRLVEFSPVCILIWFLRCLFCEEDLPHRLHVNGFSPVCILIWSDRLQFWTKALSQWGHLKGLSPVCVLECCMSELLCAKNLSHWGH